MRFISIVSPRAHRSGEDANTSCADDGSLGANDVSILNEALRQSRARGRDKLTRRVRRPFNLAERSIRISSIQFAYTTTRIISGLVQRGR
jgi:hypothetical protein